MKNYSFLLLLFCAHFALGQGNNALPDSLSKYKLDELLNTNNYEVYPMDLNQDGVEDLVLNSARYCGEDLYFFLQGEEEDYHCALKSWNFSIDGIRVIYSIEKKDNYIVLYGAFPDKNTDISSYFIKYNNGRWILDHTVYENHYGQEDYTRSYFCSQPQNIDMALITNAEGSLYPKPMPDKTERDKQCEPMYNAESLEEFAHRFEENPYDDMRIVQSVERYQQLLVLFPITSSNVEQYNHIAYRAEQNKLYHEAVYLLEQITQQFPARTEAYLRLADAYWGLNKKAKAKEAYNSYLALMEAQNLAMDKLPERVYTRSK